jgi:hypothetical protein
MWRHDRVAQQKAMTSVRDNIQNTKIPIEILPTSMFIPHSAPLVNDAEQGIAYIAMPNWQDRQTIRGIIGALATRIAQQIGLPQPPIPQPIPRQALSPQTASPHLSRHQTPAQIATQRAEA